jgi:hypothetical protein
MCGIAGYVCTTEYSKQLDTIFPLMGVFMDTRGGQAWGYTDGTRIHKELGELQESWTPELLGAKQAAIHTRYGTEGNNTKENAHPWDFGDGFIGMHNGVLDNHRALNAKYQRKCEVDSQNLLLHIKEGRDLSEVQAYGAVVFWRDGVLHLGCFNNGDLAVAQTPWGVVFASRGWAISNAFRMAGAEITTFYKITDGVLYYIKDGQLWESAEELNVGKRVDTKKWNEFGTTQLISRSGPSNTAFQTLGDTSGDCTWCTLTDCELIQTRDGLLCGQCARWAQEDADTDNACCFRAEQGEPCLCSEKDDDDDLYDAMTVRQYCQSREIADLPFDDPCMTACDKCSTTLVADDNCFVDSTDNIDVVLCDRCHTLEVVEHSDEQSLLNFTN